ncbi:hypothetical protein HanIR_Chr12g0609431 [Helianthus annuus]|nr:hypothetical protein HanIR_Chr12g0609431 [Helianthus annuus]
MVVARGPYPRRRPSHDHQKSGPPVQVGYDPLAHPQKHQGYINPGRLVLDTGAVTAAKVCRIHANHGAHSPSGAQTSGVMTVKCWRMPSV